MLGEQRIESGAVDIFLAAYSIRERVLPTPGLPTMTTMAFSLIAVAQASCN